MRLHGIEFDRERIAAFCRRHRIARLALYGSILREDFRPQSDIDVLVQFEPGHRPTLLGLAGMSIEFSDILDTERWADLKTPHSLGPERRDEVLGSALVQYDCAA